MVGKKLFSSAQFLELDSLVKEAETKTQAEIVLAISNQADVYRVSFYRQIIFWFIVVMSVSYFFFFINIYYLLIFAFCLSFISNKVLFFRKFFIFKDEQNEEFDQLAYQIFLEQKVHMTRERIGVLLMFSLMEKKLMILRDSGVKEIIEDKVFDDLVSQILAYKKTNSLNETMKFSIKKLSNILSDSLPFTEKNEDEVSKRVLVINL